MKVLSVASLWLSGIVSLVQLTGIRSDTVGYDVIQRPTLLGGIQGSMVLFNARFLSGNISSFSAYFGQNGKGFKFQVWRPMNSSHISTEFELVAQNLVEEDAIGKYEMQLTDTVRVQDGDRLGFTYDGTGDLPLSVTLVNTTIDLYRTLQPTATIGDSVGFQFLQYPAEPSISATYEPDQFVMEQGIVITGSPGATGYTGATGFTGATGPQGPPGPPGILGVPGVKGQRGDIGAPGVTGLLGYQGPLGPTGATGVPGETGATGERGVKGPAGPKGSRGPVGVAGSPGSTGATGATGRSGPPGDRGLPGLAGATGATGATGSTGATGFQGFLGYTGPRGDPGLPGLRGPPGVSGTRGAKGDRGPMFIDYDECQTTTHGCQHTCVNTFGSFHCQCHEGYQLGKDGRTCQDIDECAINNGGCQHACANTVGSFRCSCTSGTRLSRNGLLCEDINECDINRGNCAENEICVNTYGRYYCIQNNPAIFMAKPGSKGNDVWTISVEQVREEDDLLNRDVIIGILIWLFLLSLVIVSILFCLCVRKMKESSRNRRPIIAKRYHPAHLERHRRKEDACYHKDDGFY